MKRFLAIVSLLLAPWTTVAPRACTIIIEPAKCVNEFKGGATETATTVFVPYWKLFLLINSEQSVFRAAQVKQESGFNKCAVSSVGARGLSQFMPATWREQGKGNIEDPEGNLRAQNKYMNWLVIKNKGDAWRATASYNTGLGNIYRADKLSDQTGLPRTADSWMYTMPRITGPANSKQTIDYVNRIRKTTQIWKTKKIEEKK